MAKKANIQGSITALVTPFKGGQLDEQAFRARLREFFRTRVPASTREKVLEGRELSREEIVDTLQFPAYAELRNYGRLHDLIESLHHLYSPGRPRLGP